MDKILNGGNIVIIGIGLLFILIAIVIGLFKQTWLIAGVNTMPKAKLAKMDLDYLGKYFGLFFGIFGGIMVLGVFICTYLNIMHYFHRVFPFAIIAFVVFVILYFNVIKRKRIYKTSNDQQTDQTRSDLKAKDVRLNKWRTIILIVSVVPVILFIYMGYKEPTVKIDSEAFKLKGLYGVNLLFTEIAEADTIAWSKMPSISVRTNGISLSSVNRGKFRTTDGDNIHLSIYRGVSPVIRIVKQDGSVYYINRKSASETRQIFAKLKIKN